jgi:hypothetical protein
VRVSGGFDSSVVMQQIDVLADTVVALCSQGEQDLHVLAKAIDLFLLRSPNRFRRLLTNFQLKSRGRGEELLVGAGRGKRREGDLFFGLHQLVSQFFHELVGGRQRASGVGRDQFIGLGLGGDG